MEPFIRLAVAAAIVLVYRWSLGLSTPRKDYRLMRPYAVELGVHIRRGVAMIRVWLMSLVTYVPSSRVRTAWMMLRDNVAGGKYGTAGT